MNRLLRKMHAPLAALALVGVALTGSAKADVALLDGLVANWTFDEDFGNMAVDSVGSADALWLNDGLNGEQSWVTGKIGGALRFDPSFGPAGALIGNPSSLDLGANAGTIMAWVQLDVLPSDMPSQGFAGIFDSRLDSHVMYLDRGNKEIRYKVVTATSANVAFSQARPGAEEGNLTTGNWHHMVGAFDGTFTRVYCDGQLVDVVGIQKIGGVQVQSGQVAGIGYQPADPSVSGSEDDYFFSGAVDEMAVWNRALNANEVAYLYNGGAGLPVLSTNPVIAPPAPPTMPDPVVHLPMNGDLLNVGTGGSTYDGALVQGTLGSSYYETAKIGQGLRLQNDGNGHSTDGQYVSIPYTMTTNQGTISFWCKPDTFFSYMGLFDNSGSNGDPALDKEDWEMWIDSTGTIQWRTEASQTRNNTFDLDTVGGPNNWYYVTAVWQEAAGAASPGEASVHLYVNGQFVSGGDGPLVAPGDTFYLGGGNDGNEYAVATFDEFRIYDVALTPEQIEELYLLGMSSIPGDATGNGVVDDDDAKRLAANWGATTQAEGFTWWEMGDFNNDNVVDARDAAILAANWGFGSGSSEAVAAVPEPSMWLLLTASLAILLARRQR